MGEVLGYVTQTRGGPFQGLLGQHAQAANALGAFSATKKDGTVIGTSFRTMKEAQDAVQAAVGGPRLRWVRDNRDNARIERYEGQSPYWYPRDLGTLLTGGGWWRGDQGKRLEALAGGDVAVPQWSSFDGIAGTIVTARQTVTVLAAPTYGEAAYDGRDALLFDATLPQYLNSNLTSTLGAPVSIYAAARWKTAGREQVVLKTGAGGIEIRVTAAGVWEVDAGANTVNCGAAVEGRQELISLRADSTVNTTVYRGRTAIATVAGAVAAGDLVISEAPSGWYDAIAEILALTFYTNPTLHLKILEYFYRRYPNTAE